MNPKIKRLIDQIKAHLRERYGEGIKRVILYGSCASRCCYAYDTRIVGDYGVTASVAQDEAEDLLDAAQDFVQKVKSDLDQWMEKETRT